MTITQPDAQPRDSYRTMKARAGFYRGVAKRKQAQAQEYQAKADALEAQAQALKCKDQPQP